MLFKGRNIVHFQQVSLDDTENRQIRMMCCVFQNKKWMEYGLLNELFTKRKVFQGCGYSVWKWSGIEKNTHIHGNEAMKRFLSIDTYKVSEYTGMVSGWKKAWGFKLLEKDFLFSALFRTSVLFPVCDSEFPWEIKTSLDVTNEVLSRNFTCETIAANLL